MRAFLKTKCKREGAVGWPEIMVSFSGISFHIFLIACDEDIPLLQSETLAMIFFQSQSVILYIAFNNSEPIMSALSRSGKHCLRSFPVWCDFLLATS